MNGTKSCIKLILFDVDGILVSAPESRLAYKLKLHRLKFLQAITLWTYEKIISRFFSKQIQPDIRKYLHDLKNKYRIRIGIATNRSLPALLKTLEKSRIKHTLFDVIFCRIGKLQHEKIIYTGCTKPNARFLRQIIGYAAQNELPPEEILIVDDMLDYLVLAQQHKFQIAASIALIKEYTEYK